MEPLITILKQAKDQLKPGWLYLPKSKPWLADTLGIIIDDDALNESEVDENDEPILVREHGLICTLESACIEGIVSYAQELDETFTDELLLESFNYYFEHDAYLPYSGFIPTPSEDSFRQIDRDFYDSLGPERAETECKKENCVRGKIKGGVLCKIHHFEMINNKPCPFAD